MGWCLPGRRLCSGPCSRLGRICSGAFGARLYSRCRFGSFGFRLHPFPDTTDITFRATWMVPVGLSSSSSDMNFFFLFAPACRDNGRGAGLVGTLAPATFPSATSFTFPRFPAEDRSFLLVANEGGIGVSGSKNSRTIDKGGVCGSIAAGGRSDGASTGISNGDIAVFCAAMSGTAGDGSNWLKSVASDLLAS